MEVAWALPCRFAEATADGTATIIGAGLDSLWAPEVPADVGIFLMMRIAGPQYDFDEPHQLSVRLIDPEGADEEMLSAAFGPMPEPPPLLHPGMDVGMLVPAAIGWTAQSYGLFTLEVFVDERRQRSVPLLVRDAAELQR